VPASGLVPRSVPPRRFLRTSATNGHASAPSGPPPPSDRTCAMVDATTMNRNGESADVIFIAIVLTRPSPSVLGTSNGSVADGGVNTNVVAEVVGTALAGKSRNAGGAAFVLVWEVLVSRTRW
jgi:hypothetical protein